MFGNQENTLWVEKFRPGTLDGYVGNEHIIDKVKIYIENKFLLKYFLIPSLILAYKICKLIL